MSARSNTFTNRLTSWHWVSQAAVSLLPLLLSVLLNLPAEADEGTERIVWERTPIAVSLKVGQERLIHFPADVRVGLPPTFNAALRVQSINGTVYLLANEAFDSTRLLVREVEGENTFLLDVKANAAGHTHPLTVYVQQRDTTHAGAESNTADETASDTAPSHGYVALTRFAAQQVYAPKRLLRELKNVHRVPVTSDAAALLRGGRVEVEPLIGWAANGLYVTAVRLTNTSSKPVILDPRELRGQWLTATFQHARLQPHGSLADTTCVYLISARPFEDALPWSDQGFTHADDSE